jgi:hypothetical protein
MKTVYLDSVRNQARVHICLMVMKILFRDTKKSGPYLGIKPRA